MNKIVPHLWFDNNAEEAIEYYFNIFDKSKMISKQMLEDTPSGDATGFEFELAGQPFMAINGGPYFKFNESLSFMVAGEGKLEIDEIWKKLLDGGRIILPLQEYSFSEYYGWVEDKFGLTWQLISAEGVTIHQKIIPHLLFSGDVTGQAREAMDYYTTVFEDSEILNIYEYPEDGTQNPKAKIGFSVFRILDSLFHAADDGRENPMYKFNESISFMVMCEDQAEIDMYWEKLSADPEAEQCGWLKDKFGVSWQIVPRVMNEYFAKGTRAQINAVTQAFLPMKKLDIAELQRAWEEAE